MFESLLAESPATGRAARLGPVSLALALHAAVLTALAGVSVLALRPVPPGPDPPLMFVLPPPLPLEMDRPLSPPSGPSSAGAGGRRRPAPAPVEPDRTPEATPHAPAAIDSPENPPGVGGNPDEGSGFGGGPAGIGDGAGWGEGLGGGGEGTGIGGGWGTDPVPLGPAVAAPRLLVRVQPGYPSIARKARLEGEVVLRAVVAPDGSVTSVEVVRSSNAVFDEEALEAVRQWRYTPPTQHGRPVSVWFEVVVRFILR